MPYAWGQINPTWADWGILAGSFGWFGLWFLLFYKNFPIVAIQEIKEMIPMPRRDPQARGALMATTIPGVLGAFDHVDAACRRDSRTQGGRTQGPDGVLGRGAITRSRRRSAIRCRRCGCSR